MNTIGYFVDCFPVISETFVLNEIIEVRRRGVEVIVFSLSRPTVKANHPGAQEWAKKTIYLEDYLPDEHRKWLDRALRSRVADVLRGVAFRFSLPQPYAWMAMHAPPLVSEVRRVGCQRLHAHFAGPACQWAFVVSHMLSIPFGFTAHRYDIFDKPPERFDILIDAAATCVTVSEYNRRYLIDKYGKESGKFRVIPCGTNVDVFAPDCKVPRSKGQILTVGRLVPEKGYKHLLKCASLLREDKVSFNWLIVGEGPEREFIERAIKDNDLQGCVSLLGAQPSSEVRRLMATSEIFVLGSIIEAAPVVYMEAMASATPIVGTDIMGVSEIVRDGETGYLVRPENPSLMANRISELLADHVCRYRMGQEGRTHAVNNLSISGQVSKLIALWDASQQNAVSSQ